MMFTEYIYILYISCVRAYVTELLLGGWADFDVIFYHSKF